jgi:hypothetical protein
MADTETPEDLPENAPDETPKPTGRARRAALLSLRLVAGTVASVAAAATVGAVGLIPLPTVGAPPPAVEVTPVAADELRTCAGGALRLGDETGADADTAVPIGIPSVRTEAVNAGLQTSRISDSDAGNGGSAAAPQVLRIASGEGALVAGSQSQVVESDGFTGFSAASCAEPSGSIWLAGGSTRVGRTSILTISNPSEVRALVTLTVYGENGEVAAPGMSGIDVPPGAQRVLSLAGFAPGLASPVVHVEARGGQVVAYLQQSIVRGLDAVGVDLVDAAPAPATDLTFTGVRVFDSLGTNRALSLEDWDDVAPAVRILNPGDESATVTVSVTPADASIEGTSFTAQAEPGVVTELALDSGVEVDSGVALADGVYTITMDSDRPIVAGVRVSAAADIGAVETDGIVPAPPSDLAWYSASPQLGDLALVTVPPGPAPILAVANPTDAEVALVVKALGGEEATLVVPAGGTATTPLEVGTTYELQGASGLHAAVSYAADDRMAAFPVTVARPVSGPIVIRP